MKTVKFDIDYDSLDLNGMERAAVMPLVFQILTDTAHERGMKFHDGHMFSKILPKLQSMNGSQEVDLEDAEYEWFKAVVANGRLSSSQNALALMLYRAFEMIE